MATWLIGSEITRFEIKKRWFRRGSNVWRIDRAMPDGEIVYRDVNRIWIATFATGELALEYCKRRDWGTAPKDKVPTPEG